MINLLMLTAYAPSPTALNLLRLLAQNALKAGEKMKMETALLLIVWSM